MVREKGVVGGRGWERGGIGDERGDDDDDDDDDNKLYFSVKVF